MQTVSMLSRQPSLRHYAVTRCLGKTIYGKFWQVSSRREADLPNYLFVPNKLLVWPVLFERLEAFCPSPTQLRNGRVAFLIGSAVEIRELKRAIWQLDLSTVKLDPIQGFSKARRNILIPAMTALCLMALPLFQVRTSPSEHLPGVVTKGCQQELKIGSVVSFPEMARHRKTYQHTSFSLSIAKSLGGFSLLQATRACDKRKFQYKAWQNKSGFLISRKL